MKLQSSDKQQQWNQRYKEKPNTRPLPVNVLTLNQGLLSGKGDALDLACGLGGNAIFLAEQGYHVNALDYSEVALSKLEQYASQNALNIKTECCDLEQTLPKSAQYDIIVVSYYLQRDLFPELFSLLKQGGLLFYQTFGVAGEAAGGPRNPAFRLQKAELLMLCESMTVIYYREDQGCCVSGECFNNDAMIVVRKD